MNYSVLARAARYLSNPAETKQTPVNDTLRLLPTLDRKDTKDIDYELNNTNLGGLSGSNKLV